MNTYNFDVNFATGRIYGPDLLLVVNDHNSTTFKFTFDQEGRYVFKLLYPDNTIYVQDIINGELVLTKGILNQEGNYKFEISLYGDDNRLTTARIKEFPVRLELVKTDEPVQADDRLPILDNLIEETNKVVESAKNGEFDGATFTPSVSEDGDLSWSNDKGKENPPTVNIKGAKGDPGAVKMQVVDTLPDVGDTDTIYLLKKDKPGQQNLYDEYVYTEASGWEHIGDTSVDLTDYYTKEETNEKLNTKQDTLIAGDNIIIEDNVISASGGNIPTYVYLGYTVPIGIISDEKFLSELSQSITNCLTSGASAKARIDLQSGTLSTGDTISVAYTCSRTIATTRTSFTYYSDNQWIQKYIDTDNLHHYMMRSLTVSGTWSNNVFNATRIVSDFYKSNEILSMVSSSYIKANLLTKTNKTAYTPTSDYNPATKKYVDDNKYTLPVASAETLGGIKLGEGLSVDENGVVSASGEELPLVYLSYGFFSNRTITDNDFIGKVESLINDNLNEFKSKRIAAWTDTTSAPMKYMTYNCYGRVSPNATSYTFFGDSINVGTYYGELMVLSSTINVSGTWVDNHYSITSCNVNLVQGHKLTTPDTVLTKTNTTVYTPTSDYHPATKKYVDDSIAAASSIPIYDFKMTSPFTKYNPPTTYTYMTSTDKTTLQNIIQSAYDKGLESVVLIARQKYGTYTGINEQTQDYLLTTVNNSKNLIKNKPTALMLDGYNHGSMTMSDNHLSRLSILFTLKWSGDTCTVGQAKYINKDITIATQTDYQTYAGYDATKTQVLKNINGNLTWITEE